MLDITNPLYPLLPSLAIEEPSEPKDGGYFQRGSWAARHGVILSVNVHMKMMRPIGVGLSWPLTVVTMGCLDEGEPGMAMRNLTNNRFEAIVKREESWSLLERHAAVQSIPVHDGKSIQIVTHRPHREAHCGPDGLSSDPGFVADPRMIVFDGRCQVTGLSEAQARRLSLLWQALLQRQENSRLNHA